MKMSHFLLLAGVLVLSACGKQQGQQNSQPGVDRVILNANVYTVNDVQPYAEAVAIDDGLIVYVGDNAGARELIGSDTVEHDVGGKLVLPGFIDTHIHPIGAGAYANALALDTGGSIDEWVAAIDAYAKANPEMEVIFGYGFLATTFGPAGPTRQLIDAVVPERPVILMDEGFHGGWANTATLRALGITQDTPDPEPGFSYYKRDENGDATGYLVEGTAGMAMDALDVITDEVIVDGAGTIVDILNAYGVTSAFAAGSTGATGEPERMQGMLQSLQKSGDLTLRLVGAVRADRELSPAANVSLVRRWADTVSGDNYHYTMVKLANDGTLEGRTAAMFEDYQGEPGNSGETLYTEEEMTALMQAFAAGNIDVHVHAIGERAIHETLNAVEVARESSPQTDSRFTICHLEVIIDQDVPRFGELDVIAQSTPLWASYDTYGKQFVSEDQFNRYWRYKSLEDAGAKLTFGSDFPASGAGPVGMSPVVQIEIGHTRQEPGEPDAPVQPRETERLSIESLVRGFTLDAAYQLRLEDEIGSLEVGKKADVIVLDKDIFAANPYEIHQTKVTLTIFDGEVVHSLAD